MKIRRFKLLLSLQNIMIMLLVLAVLLSAARIVFDHTAYANDMENVIDEEDTADPSFINEALLYKVLNHVFPAGGIDENDSMELFGLKEVYQSIVKELVLIDLKNPLTFIRPQFPAIALYDYEANPEPPSTIPVENNEEDKDIRLVEENGDESVAVDNPVEQNTDDLGEEQEGIYLPGFPVIDSRENLILTLDDVVKPEAITLEKGKPQILIYHTHGTESYKPASEGNFHSLRKEFTVIEVGSIIANELTKRGYEVLHDTTYHDYPSYNGSYTRSLSTIQKILKENPSIKVVLDIHRDGYDNIDTNPQRESLIKNNQAIIKNEVTSKFQFVIGPETENKKAVQTFAQYVKAVSDQMYPDLSKPVLLKPYGKFNQFVVDHYLLVEVGSNANTIEEAQKAGGYFGDVLAQALKEISQ